MCSRFQLAGTLKDQKKFLFSEFSSCQVFYIEIIEERSRTKDTCKQKIPVTIVHVKKKLLYLIGNIHGKMYILDLSQRLSSFERNRNII